MRVEDYDSKCEVADPADIDAVLSKRHGDGLNSFWLSHGAEDFPAINILVRADLAYVHYFPKEREPGFASAAKVPGPRSNGTTIFFEYPSEKMWVSNRAVIPFSDALRVAQEYAVSATRPKCIDWSEL